MIEARVLLAALATAVAVGAAVRLAVRSPRRLDRRVAPYAQLARARLGRPIDAELLAGEPGMGGEGPGSVFGPIVRAAADRLSALLDAGGDVAVARRLRQAGAVATTPEQYRMRQLAWTAGGAAAGVAMALVLPPLRSAPWALGLGALCGFAGAARWRGRVDAAIERRRQRMRVELYTVAHLAAIYVRAGTASLEAVRRVCERGQGPLVDELAAAYRWVRDGMTQRAAFERLAADTPEPAAARLYRLLATVGDAAGDLAAALRAQADDLRAQRREDLERAATRRRGEMVLATIVVMAPVALLFVAAPLPTLVFAVR